MADVLSVQFGMDDYYHASSPRCRSPRPPYTTIDLDHDTEYLDNDCYDPGSYTPRKFSPPPSSSVSSSPELSSIVSSAHSSTTSSVASSVCLDDSIKTSTFDDDDELVFPVYDYVPTSVQYEGMDMDEMESCGTGMEDSQSSVATITCVDGEASILDSTAADDTFVRQEPTRHVDYLSHDWREEDIWASWRYMVRNRSHVNSARLENASWRTWAKEQHKLRTVSPEKLNWLKDCDVTWLYGPLCSGSVRYSSMLPYSPPGSPCESKLQPRTSFYNPKPILKKRSMSELMLQRSLSSSNLLKQATAALEAQQSNLYPKITRPLPTRAYSEVASFPSTTTRGSATVTQSTQTTSRLSPSPPAKRHIHFNDEVQQCIAVNKDDESGAFDEDDISDIEEEEEPRGRSRYRIIAMLPSTTLKYVEEPVKKATSFLPFNNFFSRAATSAGKSYLLDDDEDLADLDWTPKKTLGPRKKSPTGERTLESSFEDDDLQLPTYAYGDDDEENPASGIIDRAVDYVNTARDIAHVLWNVGWRR